MSIPPVGNTQALPLQICFKSQASFCPIGWHDLRCCFIFLFIFSPPLSLIGVASCITCSHRYMLIIQLNYTVIKSGIVRGHMTCWICSILRVLISRMFSFVLAEIILHNAARDKVDMKQSTQVCKKSRLERNYSVRMQILQRSKVECHALLSLTEAVSGRSDRQGKMAN